ncbi:MAG: hypothetical protein AAGB11_09900 [Pseudomonadota bacterium]
MTALALAVASGALAHTPYRQWVVYRKKHLLLGTHRDDDAGYRTAKDAAAHLVEALPASKARVARAPAPSRLASLLATDQLDVAILKPSLAAEMAAGRNVFAAYGPIDLKTLLMLSDGRMLVAHARFPDEHAELVADALLGSALATKAAQADEPPLPWHPGVIDTLNAHAAN